MKKTTDTWESFGNWQGSDAVTQLYNSEHDKTYNLTGADVAATLNLLEASWRIVMNLQQSGRPMHGTTLSTFQIQLSSLIARVRSRCSGE